MTGDDEEALDLGPCCICGKSEAVVNAIMMPFAGSVPGHGWGCFICGLPADGAVSALCTPCLVRWRRGEVEIAEICRGYCSEGREPMPDPGSRPAHAHNERLHHEAGPLRTARA